MLYWLAVSLVVLLVLYRRDVLSRLNRGVAGLLDVHQSVRFDIPISDAECRDIYEYLGRIPLPDMYLVSLIEVDDGKRDMGYITKVYPMREERYRDDDAVKCISLSIRPDARPEVIAKLGAMSSESRGQYVTGLVREDMAYRSDRELLRYGK